MISPMTPAGTRIVCIEYPVNKVWAATGKPCHLPTPPIKVGGVYTVFNIERASAAQVKFAVELVEFRGDLFGLDLFELAALPKAITDCLETVDLSLIIDEFKRQHADADARLRMPY